MRTMGLSNHKDETCHCSSCDGECSLSETDNCGRCEDCQDRYGEIDDYEDETCSYENIEEVEGEETKC